MDERTPRLGLGLPRIDWGSARSFSFEMPATLGELARARHRLRAWLHPHAPGSDALDDIVLVISELITNSAEHAFSAHVLDGRIHITARIDHDVLVAQVADNGTWRPPSGVSGARGHGLRIARAIAEAVVIEHDTRSTRVTTTFSLRREGPNA